MVLGGERLTYEELESRANQLARVLLAAGCRRGHRVALLLPKSPRAIVAMLATLKCGGAYIPLDVKSPAARLKRILNQAEPGILLCGGGTGHLMTELLGQETDVAQHSGTPMVGWLGPGTAPEGSFLSFSTKDVDLEADSPVENDGSIEDTAHILFTSGSTGLPKGVVISHRNVGTFLHWATEYFGINDSDRTSGHSPFHFDLSTLDIYGALWAGAELHLVPPQANLLPSALVQFIRESRLTQWFSVPSAMSYMASAEAIQYGDFPALRRVLWCGEVLPTPVLIHWMKRVPHASYTNLYGPTEATIASTHHRISAIPPDPTVPIPIGRPCKGEDAVVLRSDLSCAEPGEAGHLYLAGQGLSSGYWRDRNKTASAFLPAPEDLSVQGDRIYRTGDLARMDADGIIHFLGRADTQIKSRGHRIELGEIEAALGGIHELAEYAVVAISVDDFEGMVICCAYAAVAPLPPTPREIRTRLRSFLPGYMIPTQWLCLAELPKNANGKIDRNALKEHFTNEARTT